MDKGLFVENRFIVIARELRARGLVNSTIKFHNRKLLTKTTFNRFYLVERKLHNQWIPTPENIKFN
jgi:hypothetical protein